MLKEQEHIYNKETDNCVNEEFCLFYDTADDISPKGIPHDTRKRKNKQLMAIDNDTYGAALRYAFRILPEVKDYISFCKAIVDFSGREILPCCEFIYKEVISAIPFRLARKLTDTGYNNGEGYCDDDIIDSLDKEEARDDNPTNNLDELPLLNIGYTNVSEFRQLLAFVGCHNYLTPYNALILYLQNPNSTFVFNALVWKEGYDRRPKSNARPVLLQSTNGQLECMFDYGDTETMPKEINSLFDFDYELEDRWNKCLQDNRKLTIEKEMRFLQTNLPIYGIFLDWTLKANDTFVGYTDLFSDKELTIRYDGIAFKTQSHYRILVNYRYPEEDMFYFVCHELARIFCNDNCFCRIKNERTITIKEREFEVETVVWLVLRRLGIYNPLDNYLDIFCKEGKIPSYSIERIMNASAELERMLVSEVSPKLSPMYNLYDSYRTTVTNLLPN